VIRNVLTLLLAMLFWTAQTAEAVEPHFDFVMGADGEVVVADAHEGRGEPGESDACDMTCGCHVLHHMYLTGDDASWLPSPKTSRFHVFNEPGSSIRKAPPTRPPLR
jgi:hypothetical protein